LAPGNLHDVTVAPSLIALSGPLRRLIADNAHDTNAFRQLLAERGVPAIIPSSARRKLPIPHDPQIYRQRNRIERMFGRLKDFATSLPDTTSSPPTASPQSSSLECAGPGGRSSFRPRIFSPFHRRR
jgi:transposase